MIPVIQNNENGAICRACTSRCCETMPGEVFPAQLGATKQEILAGAERLLREGRYAVDWWEGDVIAGGGMSLCAYLRPAIAGEEGKLLHPSWGGRCTFLGSTGCRLKFEERPGGCQMLEPVAGEVPCRYPGEGTSKKQAALAWRELSEDLHRLADRLEARS